MAAFTLLSHNTFWFQGTPFSAAVPPEPDPDVLKRLCAFYRQVGPDVLCLQEIQGPGAFERVSGHLGMDGCHSPGTALPRYGGAVCWSSPRGRAVRSSHASAVEAQRIWQIVEIAVGGRPLRVCNIHLPSARQLGRVRAAEQRRIELQDALRCVETKPDVIAGDFNAEPEGPLGETLTRHGYVDAAVLRRRTGIPTRIGGGRVDLIWVRREMADRVSAYGVADSRALAYPRPGKQYLSDHFPLWITVELP